MIREVRVVKVPGEAVVTTVAGVGFAIAVVAWAVVGAGAATEAVALVGGVSTLATVVAVVGRWRWAAAAAVAGVVGVAGVGVAQRPSSAALFMAAGCFAHAELVFAALDDAEIGAADAAVTGQRLWLAAAVLVAALIVGAVLLGASYELTSSGLGLGVEAMGAAALTAVVALVVVLARRVGRGGASGSGHGTSRGHGSSGAQNGSATGG